jgi:hypothetical protein
MSKHVWESRKLQPRTVATGLRAMRTLRSVHKVTDPLTVVAFVGYVIESKRQKGAGCSIRQLCLGVVRSGFRFTYGDNLAGYFRVGRMVLIQGWELGTINVTLRDLTAAYLRFADRSLILDALTLYGSGLTFAIYDQLLEAGHHAAPYFASLFRPRGSERRDGIVY